MRNKALRGEIGRDLAGGTPSHTARPQSSMLSGATEGFKQRCDMIKFHFRQIILSDGQKKVGGI